ncbi:ABC transporter permease [Phytoactinopolyspora alkaliphila]|uniref:ABC transporter permease n=1 Tax=Phytoactinopolyspora alkaliphila TaxID=1783498 RepID=A0A6N9YLN9_9ACTN|nr:ABC transporter permease [Phytoactinopolyspora alkaliphila]NED95827.1 ABC transporter permease [Phytoactinopolyspora alkaliphila]
MTTATAAPAAPEVSSGRGKTLAGTGTMVRFMLRRDRIRIPVWIAALGISSISTLSSFETTYPTAADRESAAEMLELPAMVAMVGRNYAPDNYTFGAMVGHQMFIMVAAVFALMSVLLFVRHTRAEEEAGRSELIRSSVLGRHAQMTAAIIVVVGTNLLAGLFTAVGLGSSELEGVTMESAFLYGTSLALVGSTFVGIAAVTAQITEYGRGASGMALAALGLAYVVRAVGDVADNGLSWLSPLYWGFTTRSFSEGQRWWPLLLLVGLTVVLIALAVNLSTRRDVGAGLRPSRLGSPTASHALSTPLGLAVRLQRGSIIGWGVAMIVFGIAYGSVLDGAEEMFAQISALEDMIPDIEGAGLVESWVSNLMSFLAMIVSIFAILAVLRLRTEEVGRRAEPVLSTAVSRQQWVGSHLTVAFGGSAVVMLLAGASFGLSGAIVTEDGGLFGRILGATAAQIPAVWVAAGLAVALFGLIPRFINVAWIIPVYGVVVVYMGGLFGLDPWTRNLSPSGHVPELPAADFEALPLAILLVIAAALTWLGLAGFKRRDLTTT